MLALLQGLRREVLLSPYPVQAPGPGHAPPLARSWKADTAHLVRGVHIGGRAQEGAVGTVTGLG